MEGGAKEKEMCLFDCDLMKMHRRNGFLIWKIHQKVISRMADGFVQTFFIACVMTDDSMFLHTKKKEEKKYTHSDLFSYTNIM